MISKRNVCVAMVLTSLLGLNSAWAQMPEYGNVFEIPKQVEDFSLYAINNITARHSDVYGSMGSGGSVDLNHYHIYGHDKNSVGLSAMGNLTLRNLEVFEYLKDETLFSKRSIEAAGDIDIKSSAVYSQVMSKRVVKVTYANIGGEITALNIIKELAGTNGLKYNPGELKVDHSNIIEDFKKKSQKMAEFVSNTLVRYKDRDIRVDANQPFSIAQIDLSNLDDKKINIVSSNKNNKLIININANEVSMKHMFVKLNGILPQNIRWNLSKATKLEIINTASGEYGIPGRVYAPSAITKFQLARITGGLYVDTLVFADFDEAEGAPINELANVKTGQINNFDPPPSKKQLLK